MKQPFELIDFNFEKLCALSPSGEDFVSIWHAYLCACGWTEEEYEKELESRVFSSLLEN